MGWARTLLLGDIGNRLDIADNEREIDDVRRQLRTNKRVDASQEAAIEALRKENEELELCLATLIKMLERKGTLSPSEVNALVKRTEL